MDSNIQAYKAVVSSDWNGCLAPSGPFDFIAFNYPKLSKSLNTIFKQYTGNIISLGEATQQIEKLLPAPITETQMDAYLADSFMTYKGVPQFIEWCSNHNILFMINTTGTIGYFQRIFANKLLPPVPVLSAHPMIRYPSRNSDPHFTYNLYEIDDKSRNTATVVQSLNISSGKAILMGDSGGDGPHFEWGAKVNAFLVGSMTKPSLTKYCRKKNINIDAYFGISYSENKKKDLKNELQVNFMDLSTCITNFLARQRKHG